MGEVRVRGPEKPLVVSQESSGVTFIKQTIIVGEFNEPGKGKVGVLILIVDC
jgi:hypothetical protein